MLGGEGRAAGGHRPLDARQVAPDHVGIPLAHHQFVGPPRLALSPVEPVKHLALGVELGGVRGVLVLRSLTIGQFASTEPNGVALGVEDWKHDPGPEEVVLAAPLVDATQPGGHPLVVFQPQVARQLGPLVGCPPDLEPAGHITVVAP